MKVRKIKRKVTKTAQERSKIKTALLELSKIKKPFRRSKLVELGMNPFSETLIKHFFLEKNLRTGFWKFSKKKIEVRGYKNLKDLSSNEGFFRIDLLYLMRTKNEIKVPKIKPRNVSDKDLRISENLFNLTYSL